MRGNIYTITNIENGNQYVGQTIDYESRKYNHFYNLNKNQHNNRYLQNAFNKYEQENFKMEIIEENIKQENLDEREIYWIEKLDTFNNGYNLTKGGDGLRGYKLSEETKEKISKNQKDYSGENNPRYGVSLSEETKNKIGEANKNNKYWLGKTHTKETKNKISKKRIKNKVAKGGKNPNSKITKQEGEEIYNKYYNCSKTTIDKLTTKYQISSSVIHRIINAKHWTTKDKKASDSHIKLKTLYKGSGNPQSKVSLKLGHKIFDKYQKDDVKYKHLKDEHNLSVSTISKIVNKQHWTTENY